MTLLLLACGVAGCAGASVPPNGDRAAVATAPMAAGPDVMDVPAANATRTPARGSARDAAQFFDSYARVLYGYGGTVHNAMPTLAARVKQQASAPSDGASGPPTATVVTVTKTSARTVDATAMINDPLLGRYPLFASFTQTDGRWHATTVGG